MVINYKLLYVETLMSNITAYTIQNSDSNRSCLEKLKFPFAGHDNSHNYPTEATLARNRILYLVYVRM